MLRAQKQGREFGCNVSSPCRDIVPGSLSSLRATDLAGHFLGHVVSETHKSAFIKRGKEEEEEEHQNRRKGKEIIDSNLAGNLNLQVYSGVRKFGLHTFQFREARKWREI